jgi:hypothetical protein
MKLDHLAAKEWANHIHPHSPDANLAACYLDSQEQLKRLWELAWAVDTDNYHIVCNDVGDTNWFDQREELSKEE